MNVAVNVGDEVIVDDRVGEYVDVAVSLGVPVGVVDGDTTAPKDGVTEHVAEYDGVDEYDDVIVGVGVTVGVAVDVEPNDGDTDTAGVTEGLPGVALAEYVDVGVNDGVTVTVTVKVGVAVPLEPNDEESEMLAVTVALPGVGVAEYVDVRVTVTVIETLGVRVEVELGVAVDVPPPPLLGENVGVVVTVLVTDGLPDATAPNDGDTLVDGENVTVLVVLGEGVEVPPANVGETLAVTVDVEVPVRVLVAV